MFRPICKKNIIKNLFGNHSIKIQVLRNFTSVYCWKCGSSRRSEDIFCNKCNTIQSPYEKNYFKLFKLNSDFNIDLKQLGQTYRNMQSQLHPDKFSNKSAEEVAISEQYSSLLNKAYNVLQAPLNRALHLLALHNEYIDEDNKDMDRGFLMKIMDLNEEVEEAKTDEELRQLNVKNASALKLMQNEVSEFFKAGDIKNAKEIVQRMKYYNSLSQRINDLLRERGVVE